MSFQQAYDERFQAKYGYWSRRAGIERSVTAFLQCGDLHQGFARIRCPDCTQEMFVAYSCKQRCTCPSCHQKRPGAPGLATCGAFTAEGDFLELPEFDGDQLLVDAA
jgi:hypothetical protein